MFPFNSLKNFTPFTSYIFQQSFGLSDCIKQLINLLLLIFTSDNVSPICLPTNKQKYMLQENKMGVVVGWGVTTSLRKSDLLKELELPVASQSDCREVFSKRGDIYGVTSDMFCAGYKDTTDDTCKGDSGGGFLLYDSRKKKWVLQGVVSWGGKACGQEGQYSVYAKVSRFSNWIRKMTKPKLSRQKRST